MNIPPIVERVYWHIGYTKAASTYLQQWFAQSSAVYFDPMRPGWNHFVKQSDASFNLNTAKLWVAEHIRSARDKPVLFSHERLSGNPHSGHYDQMEIARRIKQVTPNAHIIVVTRERTDLLKSIYRQYIRAGGGRTASQYFNQQWDGRTPRFNFAPYDYANVMAQYYRIFGQDNVTLAKFEDLKANETAFQANLINQTGLSLTPQVIGQVNSSLTDAELKTRWIDNVMGDVGLVSLCDPLQLMHGAPDKLKRELREWLAAKWQNDYVQIINSL